MKKKFEVKRELSVDNLTIGLDKISKNDDILSALIFNLAYSLSRSILGTLYIERRKGQKDIIKNLSRKYPEIFVNIKEDQRRTNKIRTRTMKLIREALDLKKQDYLSLLFILLKTKSISEATEMLVSNYIKKDLKSYIDVLDKEFKNDYEEKLNLFTSRFSEYLLSFLGLTDIVYWNHEKMLKEFCPGRNFFNNEKLMNRIYGMVKQKEGRLIFIDIGDLKLFNEIFSFSFGNFIIAKVIENIKLGYFLVAFGGDEFVVFDIEKDQIIKEKLLLGLNIKLIYFEKLFRNNNVRKEIIDFFVNFKKNINSGNKYKNYKIEFNNNGVRIGFKVKNNKVRYTLNGKQGKGYFYIEKGSLYLKLYLAVDEKDLSDKRYCYINFHELYKSFVKK